MLSWMYVQIWVQIIIFEQHHGWKPELLVGVDAPSLDSALLVAQEVLFRLVLSSSSMENTRSLCSSSILLVLTGDEIVRSRRLLEPTAGEWRVGAG